MTLRRFFTHRHDSTLNAPRFYVMLMLAAALMALCVSAAFAGAYEDLQTMRAQQALEDAAEAKSLADDEARGYDRLTGMTAADRAKQDAKDDRDQRAYEKMVKGGNAAGFKILMDKLKKECPKHFGKAC